MRLAKFIAVVFLCVSAAVTFAWFAFPETSSGVLLRLNNARAGLSEKSITTPISDVAYLEGGSGQKVVLIHGIFSRKEHWVDFARRLTDDYQVIVIDLPGFGDNGLLPDSEYALQKQSENLSAVFDALELSDVHVGANSMGASIIAQIAVEQPDRIASLAFIGSPLGVTSPTLSDMERAIAEGKTPLLVRSQEEFEGRNSWLSPNGISVPQPILTTWMHAELAQVEKNARIWAVVHDENPVPDLLELAPKLNMPTQILWCTEDRIFHVNGAAVLARKLSSAKLDVLDNCGHVPMVDAPEETAMRYLNFLTSLRTSIKPTD